MMCLYAEVTACQLAASWQMCFFIHSFLLLLFKFWGVIFIMSVLARMHVCVPHVSLVPSEVRKGPQNP